MGLSKVKNYFIYTSHQMGLSFRSCSILLIIRMIADRIRLHSVLLLLLTKTSSFQFLPVVPTGVLLKEFIIQNLVLFHTKPFNCFRLQTFIKPYCHTALKSVSTPNHNTTISFYLSKRYKFFLFLKIIGFRLHVLQHPMQLRQEVHGSHYHHCKRCMAIGYGEYTNSYP